MAQGSSIRSLVGEPLNAVSFVMDYVELHFNGSTVRALTAPYVEATHSVVRFPDAGSRDALCHLIGREVTQIDLSEHVLRLTFGTSAIRIPLDDGSATGPEVLHWIPHRRTVEVWRSGDLAG